MPRAEEAPPATPVATGPPPDTAEQYLDLVEQYRAGEDTTEVLAAYTFDGIRDVVSRLSFIRAGAN